MVTEFKWDEAKIILWCTCYDSDAYIGCKLHENNYYKGWTNKNKEAMHVEVRMKDGNGLYSLYAAGDDIKNIGKSGYFRLAPPPESKMCYVDLPAGIEG